MTCWWRASPRQAGPSCGGSPGWCTAARSRCTTPTARSAGSTATSTSTPSGETTARCYNSLFSEVAMLVHKLSHIYLFEHKVIYRYSGGAQLHLLAAPSHHRAVPLPDTCYDPRSGTVPHHPVPVFTPGGQLWLIFLWFYRILVTFLLDSTCCEDGDVYFYDYDTDNIFWYSSSLSRLRYGQHESLRVVPQEANTSKFIFQNK